MEEENFSTNEIGSLARFIDSEMTIVERMKIRKESLIKVIVALIVYSTVMVVFSLVM